jgi:hypothetical protein
MSNVHSNGSATPNRHARKIFLTHRMPPSTAHTNNLLPQISPQSWTSRIRSGSKKSWEPSYITPELSIAPCWHPLAHCPPNNHKLQNKNHDWSDTIAKLLCLPSGSCRRISLEEHGPPCGRRRIILVRTQRTIVSHRVPLFE